MPRQTNILERLHAMGYKQAYEHKRLGIVLDDMAVAAIVDQVPIAFTRRRYSNATFCWVHFYAGGWSDLGDPFQCVTPSERSISEELQRRQAIVEKQATCPPG